MKNKIVVGTPTKLQYSRLELENMAKYLFSETYIEVDRFRTFQYDY